MLGGPPWPMRTGALILFIFLYKLSTSMKHESIPNHQPRQHRQANPITNTRARPHVRVLSFVIVNRYG